MKTAKVNGAEISAEAVRFELDRLIRFYASHGMTADEVRKNLPRLQEKALEQAIGAKLLLDRASQLDLPVGAKEVDDEVAKVVAQVGGEENYRKALAAQNLPEADFRRELEKGARVNKLVEQACTGVAEPTEKDVADFYEAHRSEYYAESKDTGRRVALTLVDVHDQIKDLLRHEARGRAVEAFVRELREAATVEYVETGCSCGHDHGHGHECGCGHHH